jgi:hypothetical protein
MITVGRLFVAVAVCISAAAFVTHASAQIDTQAKPPGPSSKIPAHRVAALKKCTDGIKFESDKYVACMTKEGENP